MTAIPPSTHCTSRCLSLSTCYGHCMHACYIYILVCTGKRAGISYSLRIPLQQNQRLLQLKSKLFLFCLYILPLNDRTSTTTTSALRSPLLPASLTFQDSNERADSSITAVGPTHVTMPKTI
ncbi:hypothetical protein CYLTODRAFT_92892 [Cylindrobasidium torrendii FP15055 ss-10]|uniref:Uncharacterized protein n=1 Tax=Cylindrobasidium torrendii FP15055 ss-10 TaxID=1314674 RepID=A0A0D7BWR6_9AGAR|nr:hypothetical protein CYLTODRAFT_92892 [Cylindrobasidium torrendii FP15055 ss-10]